MPSENLLRSPYTNAGNYLLLTCAFLLLLGLVLFQAKIYPYYEDDFYNFRKVLIARANPSEIWKPYDTEPRRAPLAVFFFTLETIFFGFGAGPYLLILLLFHFFNSILVARLCKTLGGSSADQVLSGLFFLCASNFYPVIVHIIGTARVISLFFMLLATLSWIKFLRRGTAWLLIGAFAFQGISMAFNEGPMVFPLLTLWMILQLLPDIQKPVRKKVWISQVALTVFSAVLVIIICIPAFSSPDTLYQLSGTFRPLFKVATLVIALIVPLFVLPRGFCGGIRFFPFFFFFFIVSFLFIQGLRKNKEDILGHLPRTRLVTVGLAWVAFSVPPYLLHPLAFYHTPRYLYFPAVGFSLVVGALAAYVLRVAGYLFHKLGTMLAILGVVYILSMNLISTAYQYQRYVLWVTGEHRSYYDDVRRLFLKQSA